MSELNLAAIQQRWQATTPGEWITTANTEGSAYELRIVTLQGDDPDPDARLITLIDLGSTDADATAADLVFMAEAHQDVPQMIEEINRLRAELAAVPVEAINRYWRNSSAPTFDEQYSGDQYDEDYDEIEPWLILQMAQIAERRSHDAPR